MARPRVAAAASRGCSGCSVERSSVEGDAKKTDIVFDEEEVVGCLHPGKLVLKHRHHLRDRDLPEEVNIRPGNQAAAGAEDAVLDDEESSNLSEEGLVGLEEGGHGGDLEVGGELQLAVLEVVLAEALLESEGLVDVVGAVERRRAAGAAGTLRKAERFVRSRRQRRAAAAGETSRRQWLADHGERGRRWLLGLQLWPRGREVEGAAGAMRGGSTEGRMACRGWCAQMVHAASERKKMACAGAGCAAPEKMIRPEGLRGSREEDPCELPEVDWREGREKKRPAIRQGFSPLSSSFPPFFFSAPLFFLLLLLSF